MNIILLRLIVLFYFAGLIFLIVKLLSSDMVKNKRRFWAVILFPICLATPEGRKFLSDIIHEKTK